MSVDLALPNPWVPYLLVGAGVLLTAVTWLTQVRALPAAFRAWASPKLRPSLLLVLASATGVGVLAGTAVAVGLGGPGALLWMWIATLLGMALHYAEGSLACQERDRQHLPYMAAGLPRVGRPLAIVFALGVVALAVLLGMLQTQQTAALLEGWRVPAPWLTGALALLALGSALVPGLRRVLLGVLVPVAWVAFIGAAAAITFGDPLLVKLALGDAVNQGLGLVPAVSGVGGGAIAVALHHGVLRATLGTGVGLGVAALGHEGEGAPRPELPHRYGAGAMLVPLVLGGIVSTLAALVVLTAPAAEPVASPRPLPLERHHSRGLLPNPQVGQTIILPEHTPLRADAFYRVVLRANPRGHQVAKLFKEDNAVVVANWGITEGTDTIVFRSKDPARERSSAWDVRIPAKREIIGEGPRKLLKLTPVEEDLELAKLIAYYELDPRPYIELDDFVFVGQVARARSPDPSIGDHLALFEPKQAERPFNPVLHEFFRLGYRGPYPADDPSRPADVARPPWAFVAEPEVELELGDRVPLEVRGNARGDDLVRVNRVGGAEGPPWDLLLRSRSLVLRHQSDPAADIVIPVRPELDGFRIRFRPDDPAWQDFRKVGKGELADSEGPFVVVPPYRFEAEVHTGVRLPEEGDAARALVPLDLPPEPVGPTTLPARPHPAELLALGLEGPFLVHEGIDAVAQPFAHRAPGWGPPLLVGILVTLTLGALVAWSTLAARAVEFLVGRPAARGLGLAVLVAAGLGGLCAFGPLLAWADVALILVLVPNLLGLVLLARRVRGRSSEA